MRFIIVLLLLLMSLPMTIQTAQAQQAASEHQGTLIRRIDMEGFVLGDKEEFVKLFKPYRNKYLTSADMDDILSKIQGIYELDGYKQLVSITYQVDKHRLVYTALLTS